MRFYSFEIICGETELSEIRWFTNKSKAEKELLVEETKASIDEIGSRPNMVLSIDTWDIPTAKKDLLKWLKYYNINSI